MNDLNFLTRQVEGVVILDLAGRIAIGETSAELQNTLRALVGEGKRQVVLNLQKVTGVDSSGLGTLVAAFANLERHGGHLKLANLPPNVAGLMTMTKLHTVFDIFDDVQGAVASFEENGERITQQLQIQTIQMRKSGGSIV